MATVACILSLRLAAVRGGDCPTEGRSQEQSSWMAHPGEAREGLFRGRSIGCETPNFHAPAAYRDHRSCRGQLVRAHLRAGLSREPGYLKGNGEKEADARFSSSPARIKASRFRTRQSQIYRAPISGSQARGSERGMR